MSSHDVLFQSLEEQGWAVDDALIPPSWRETLFAQGRRLWQNGQFHAAHVGGGVASALQPGIRGDSTCWIEPQSPHASHPFFTWITQFSLALNERYRLGLRSHEFHFARYDVGASYKKHIDQHRESGHRKISVVLYLNPHWRCEDGGELCLYDAGDVMRQARRVLPQPARLVVFRSDRIPHEVLAGRRVRWSLSGWLRSDDIRA